MQTKQEIIHGLETNVAHFIKWIEKQDADRFTWAPSPEKWSTGQHLSHLIRSTQPLNLAYRLPYWTVGLVGGRKNERPERTYQELVQRYKERLAQGGQASGRYVPPVIETHQKADLLAQFRRENDRLQQVIAKHSEKQLGIYLLPHPLLGKLTMREMLYFAVHHVAHHYQILVEQYEG